MIKMEENKCKYCGLSINILSPDYDIYALCERCMKNPTVVQIIKEYLKRNSYDGLYTFECGCEIDNLCPCRSTENMLYCRAGYKTKSENSEFDFIIQPNREKEL